MQHPEAAASYCRSGNDIHHDNWPDRCWNLPWFQYNPDRLSCVYWHQLLYILQANDFSCIIYSNIDCSTLGTGKTTNPFQIFRPSGLFIFDILTFWHFYSLRYVNLLESFLEIITTLSTFSEWALHCYRFFEKVNTVWLFLQITKEISAERSASLHKSNTKNIDIWSKRVSFRSFYHTKWQFVHDWKIIIFQDIMDICNNGLNSIISVFSVINPFQCRLKPIYKNLRIEIYVYIISFQRLIMIVQS